MRTVEHNGKSYTLKKGIEPTDFSGMSELQILVWINSNTKAKGYIRQLNPLSGIGDAIKIN